MAADQIIKERYPQAWNWLSQHPDLLGIYKQSVDEGWPQERLQAELSNTGYYKKTSDKERAWDVLAASNPGEADKLKRQTNVKVADYMNQLGYPASVSTIANIAAAVARWGSSDEEIHDLVVGLASKIPQAWKVPGEFGATMTKVRKVADEYAVPLSDKAAADEAQNMLVGQSRGGRNNEDQLRDRLTKQAISLYPPLKEELESGRTVADWAQPYKAVAAQELGVAADAITFNDPKWKAMLTPTPAAAGQPATMPTLAEWQTKIRTDGQYGYDATVGGRAAAAGMADQIAKMFGAGA